MNTGVYGMGSIYAVDVGTRWWMVQHNDNSDYGHKQNYFHTKKEALEYAKTIEDNLLDVRVFKVERLDLSS